MYSVSDSYKKALLEKHITDTVEGTVTLKNGTVINLTDSTIVTGSLRISHELCDDYRIGTFNLGSMHIGFFDDNALGRDFSGAKITLTYKIETEAGWESVPLGIFIADGQSVIRRRDTVTLTAYDYGILFDCTLGTTIRNMSGKAEDIVSAACERCGVVFGGIDDGLPNTNVTLNPSSQRIQSCRDLVGWCAALLCGYAVIDRNGKLKIISARYDVETEDPTEIIVDKYLTSAERNSIYSTDTRAWIAQMSAYSAGKTKVYKSNITRDDSQAARAVYYLENNPLTENMSESLCDYINCNWLSFIDGFMQRGITAELYGDPAVDVGDVMRCSEGDIDQRRSVVGLVTKQEWRYRDYHTVICASAQLSDGIEGGGEEEDETSEAQAVGETDNIYPVKVISQSEKRATDSGKEYFAGQGLSLSEDNVFTLNVANQSDIGGIRLPSRTNVPADDTSTDRNLGIYKGSDAFPALRTARNNQKGGMFLGDGLVPHLDIMSQTESGLQYKITDYVEVRIGEGLEYVDESYSDLLESARAEYGGRAIAVPKATNEKFGIVKLGKRLGLDEEGKVYAVMVGRDGISVSDNGEISVDIDNETLKIDGNGKLAVVGGGSGVAIENAVIIKEAEASYLLHNFTEVQYVDGNRIGYAGPSNPIIVGGYAVYSSKSSYPEQAPYTKMVFPLASASSVAVPVENVDFYMDFSTVGTTTTTIYLKSDALGTSQSGGSTYDLSVSGVYATWNSIYAPTSNYPYGYISFNISTLYKNNSGDMSRGTTRTYYAGFASEAEYNAAIGLTYEPNVLTEVQETVTEV